MALTMHLDISGPLITNASFTFSRSGYYLRIPAGQFDDIIFFSYNVSSDRNGGPVHSNHLWVTIFIANLESDILFFSINRVHV